MNIIQRFLSDTPIFFKKAQGFGAFLIMLATGLAEVTVIPKTYVVILASIGASIVAMASLAVKDATTLTTGVTTTTVLQTLPDAINAVKQVEQTIQTIKTGGEPATSTTISADNLPEGTVTQKNL